MADGRAYTLELVLDSSDEPVCVHACVRACEHACARASPSSGKPVSPRVDPKPLSGLAAAGAANPFASGCAFRLHPSSHAVAGMLWQARCRHGRRGQVATRADSPSQPELLVQTSCAWVSPVRSCSFSEQYAWRQHAFCQSWLS